MSLFDKFKILSDVADDLTKEKPTITLKGNNLLSCENYKSVRLFQDACIVIEFADYDVNVTGQSLVIQSFTPAVLSLSGKITTIEYSTSQIGEVDYNRLEE